MAIAIKRSGTARIAICMAIGFTALLSAGCTIVSTEEAQAIRQRGSGSFDVAAFVRSNWDRRVIPTFRQRAIGIGDVAATAPQQWNDIGRNHGVRASEGAAWTIAVAGNGVVRAVERAGPRGRVTVAVDGGQAILQTGPLVSGTAVRDALPFVRFDDVPDQIAFAELGEALNARALRGVAATLSTLRPGDRIRFTGAMTLNPEASTLLVTPVTIDRSAPTANAPS